MCSATEILYKIQTSSADPLTKTCVEQRKSYRKSTTSSADPETKFSATTEILYKIHTPSADSEPKFVWYNENPIESPHPERRPSDQNLCDTTEIL